MKKVNLLIAAVCAIICTACMSKSQVSMPDTFTSTCYVESYYAYFNLKIQRQPYEIEGVSVIPTGRLGVVLSHNRDMSDSIVYVYNDNEYGTNNTTVAFNSEYPMQLSLSNGKYYYYAYAEAPYSKVLTTCVDSFIVGRAAEAPTFSDVAVFTDVTATSMTISFRILSKGASDIWQYGLCWNTRGLPTLNDAYSENYASAYEQEYLLNNVLTTSIYNFMPGTTYYYRAYAITSDGIFYSNVWVITTQYE